MSALKTFFENLFKKKGKVEKVDLTRRFDLIGRVGQGSMSKVWRARDAMTGKVRAVKVLDKRKTQRFESRFIGLSKPTEGQVAIQLKHPNIVRTLEHGITTDDEQFIVMEFIEGVSLSYLVDMQNELMQKNRLRFIIEIGEALDHVHKNNLIFRDLCPRNVLIDNDHQVKLIDFGLVVPNTPDFRRPGNRTGTASYMAPELIKRQQTDHRIDIFSYTVTIYEMFTRKLPWDATETIDTVLQRINKPPRDIRELTPDMDEEIAETIMRGLKSYPPDRWSSARQITERFRDAERRLAGEKASDSEDD